MILWKIKPSIQKDVLLSRTILIKDNSNNPKKKIQMNLCMKQTHRHGKQIYGYQKGKGGGLN